MRRFAPAAILGLFVSLLSSSSSHAEESLAPTGGRKKVEIVFALDTTGSMGGLIDGAKRKIWSIANEVARAKEKPEVKIGIVAYRDRGDAYVTKLTPLTTNLDAIYETLMGLQAEGGGDGPEDVNAALGDAVTKMQWSAGKDTLKLVFLVGDAPPHMDYEGQTQWQASAQAALRKNIYINAVQCGGDTTTTAVWRDIAHAAEGRYAAIAQDGGVAVAVATPYDEDLGRLARELDATSLTYGRAEERKEKVASRARAADYAAAAAPAASADRAVAKASTGAGMSVLEDLVSLASSRGPAGAAAAVASVSDDALPDELRGKSTEERTRIVQEKQARRAEVQKQIVELSKKRDAHIAAASKARGGDKDGFDAEVVEMLHAEAGRAGLSY